MFKILVIMAAAAPWLSELPPPPEPVPALPAGELLLVAGKEGNAAFLVEDSVRRSGDTADFWIYRVYDPPMPFFGGLSQEMTHERVDCVLRSHEALSSFSYGDEGDVRVWSDREPPEAIEPRHAMEHFAKVVCDGVKLPDRNRLAGHKAAFEGARFMLRLPGGPPVLESIP